MTSKMGGGGEGRGDVCQREESCGRGGADCAKSGVTERHCHEHFIQ